jgi:hypothetical protein
MRSRKTSITFPAARAEGLLVERVGDETVVYDVESKEAHCLKALASVVFEHADGKTSAEDIAAVAGQRLGEPVGFAEIQDAIAQLEDCALLDTPLRIRDGLSRRDLVRNVGYAGAAATVAGPLITSIISPSAAYAGLSKIAAGCSGCSANQDCAPAPDQSVHAAGHCCQGNSGKSCNQGCCVGANNSCHACNCTTATDCHCTVVASDIGGTCPCICSDPNCTGPCCPDLAHLCCVTSIGVGCN